MTSGSKVMAHYACYVIFMTLTLTLTFQGHVISIMSAYPYDNLV